MIKEKIINNKKRKGSLKQNKVELLQSGNQNRIRFKILSCFLFFSFKCFWKIRELGVVWFGNFGGFLKKTTTYFSAFLKFLLIFPKVLFVLFLFVVCFDN